MNNRDAMTYSEGGWEVEEGEMRKRRNEFVSKGGKFLIRFLIFVKFVIFA